MMGEKDGIIQGIVDAALIWDRFESQYETAWQRMFRRMRTIRHVDSVTFNNATTSYTSDAFYCAPYEKMAIFIDLAVSGTPTRVQIQIQFSHDGATWFDYIRGPFQALYYEDSAGDQKDCIDADVQGEYVRFVITATGTDASNTFTLTLDGQYRS
jgi:hypothetical protein